MKSDYEIGEVKDVEEIDLEHIQIGDFDESSLTMKRLPWSLWVLSLVSFFSASFLLGNLMTGKIFKGFDNKVWWQYFIVVLLYVFGLVLFLFGKIEIVRFDKIGGYFSDNKWILCYKWKGFKTDLADIQSVTLQKEGKKNEFDDSIHYKILISFKQSAPLKVLETKSRKRAIEKVKEIKEFLGIKGDIQIRDLSTN